MTDFVNNFESANAVYKGKLYKKCVKLINTKDTFYLAFSHSQI